MADDKKTLHPRNPHNSRYDFNALAKSEPLLNKFITVNEYGDHTINFADPDAVLNLNKALLSHFYRIDDWSIPKDYLCPPIPGRADYIHHIADLLALDYKGKIPTGKEVKGLDIGVGANCIYPIIGITTYGWDFTVSDIEQSSLDNVQNIINSNKTLQSKINSKLQTNKHNIFKNIIEPNDKYDFTMCNPPFHSSQEEAIKGSFRKVKNLTKDKNTDLILNFAGQANELWCKGGEAAFIKKMIKESKEFKNNCKWFTTLVSKKDNLKAIYKTLKFVDVKEHKIIQMYQGNKITRIVCWRF